MMPSASDPAAELPRRVPDARPARTRPLHHQRAALGLVLVSGLAFFLILGAGGGPLRPAAAAEAVIPLPPPSLTGTMTVEEALQRRRSIRRFSPDAIDLSDLSQVLWAGQGVTDPRGFRTAPSAGALYPLKIHVMIGRVGHLPTGHYRYVSDLHGLAPIGTADLRPALARDAYDQAWVADGAALFILTGVVGQTARKYGTRAERFVLLEAGHAAQNMQLQATARGLGLAIVGAFEDRQVADRLGLPAGEIPLYFLSLGRPAR